MRGLKGQENERFERFFALIQQAAARQNAVFFAFAGEGKTFETPQMEGEEMSGWLIGKDKADSFEKQWQENNSLPALEEWSDNLVWATWTMQDGTPAIQFQAL